MFDYIIAFFCRTTGSSSDGSTQKTAHQLEREFQRLKKRAFQTRYGTRRP